MQGVRDAVPKHVNQVLYDSEQPHTAHSDDADSAVTSESELGKSRSEFSERGGFLSKRGGADSVRNARGQYGGQDRGRNGFQQQGMGWNGRRIVNEHSASANSLETFGEASQQRGGTGYKSKRQQENNRMGNQQGRNTGTERAWRQNPDMSGRQAWNVNAQHAQTAASDSNQYMSQVSIQTHAMHQMYTPNQLDNQQQQRHNNLQGRRGKGDMRIRSQFGLPRNSGRSGMGGRNNRYDGGYIRRAQGNQGYRQDEGPYQIQSAPDSPDQSIGRMESDFDRFIKKATPSMHCGPGCVKKRIEDLTLEDLWNWYKEPGYFGQEVYTLGGERGRPSYSYYVPYLSALHLLGNGQSTNGAKSYQYTDQQDDTAAHWCHTEVEHYETTEPFQRPPFFDQLTNLASHANAHPSSSNDGPYLLKEKIVNLHPSSWFSVAWYPIYRIPEASVRGRFLCFYRISQIEKTMHPDPMHDIMHLHQGLEDGNPAELDNNMYQIYKVQVPVNGALWYNTQVERWFDCLQVKNVSSDGALSPVKYQQLQQQTGDMWAGQGIQGSGGPVCVVDAGDMPLSIDLPDRLRRSAFYIGQQSMLFDHNGCALNQYDLDKNKDFEFFQKRCKPLTDLAFHQGDARYQGMQWMHGGGRDIWDRRSSGWQQQNNWHSRQQQQFQQQQHQQSQQHQQQQPHQQQQQVQGTSPTASVTEVTTTVKTPAANTSATAFSTQKGSDAEATEKEGSKNGTDCDVVDKQQSSKAALDKGHKLHQHPILIEDAPSSGNLSSTEQTKKRGPEDSATGTTMTEASESSNLTPETTKTLQPEAIPTQEQSQCTASNEMKDQIPVAEEKVNINAGNLAQQVVDPQITSTEQSSSQKPVVDYSNVEEQTEPTAHTQPVIAHDDGDVDGWGSGSLTPTGQAREAETSAPPDTSQPAQQTESSNVQEDSMECADVRGEEHSTPDSHKLALNASNAVAAQEEALAAQQVESFQVVQQDSDCSQRDGDDEQTIVDAQQQVCEQTSCGNSYSENSQNEQNIVSTKDPEVAEIEKGDPISSESEKLVGDQQACTAPQPVLSSLPYKAQQTTSVDMPDVLCDNSAVVGAAEQPEPAQMLDTGRAGTQLDTRQQPQEDCADDRSVDGWDVDTPALQQSAEAQDQHNAGSLVHVGPQEGSNPAQPKQEQRPEGVEGEAIQSE